MWPVANIRPVGRQTENLLRDNGSESAWEFRRATTKLVTREYLSRVKISNDNLEMESFNQTLDYEWLYNFSPSLDPGELSPRSPEWLTEHKPNRLHQFLSYLSPIEYIERKVVKMSHPVSPMW